jgi:hypothetical protein
MLTTKRRPFVITLLIILFIIGTIASLISVISLSSPGSFLEVVWRVNPHAREGFARMGGWSVLLMLAVCVSCLLAAIGLWRGLRWAYWLAIAMLGINLTGSIINVVAGTEPEALVGIPIVLILLIYLLRNKTRERFES